VTSQGVPEWASILGEEYGVFRAALVAVLAEMDIAVDHDHIDHGVLHTPSAGTMGLNNVVRLCKSAPPDRWREVIGEHLRRATAKPEAMDFAAARSNLRVRITPERLVHANPAHYVMRELGDGLYLTAAIDKPEHVVFVNPKELAAWSVSGDEVIEIALENTRSEPALEREDVEIEGGASVSVLFGDSYFAASHLLFLERYLTIGEYGVLVAVPDRHSLAVLPLEDKRSLASLGPLVSLAHRRFAEQPGAITDQLYWRRGETYTKLTCGVRAGDGPWVAPPDLFNDLVATLR
jgi:hypothetical protein